jgi:hypothetical protein
VIEALLQLLIRSDVEVQINERTLEKEDQQLPLSPNFGENITDRLHGIISLPANFDYKSAIADELLRKYA